MSTLNADRMLPPTSPPPPVPPMPPKRVRGLTLLEALLVTQPPTHRA